MTRRASPEEHADHDRDMRKHDDTPAQRRIKPICPRCGSSDVKSDAYAEWCVETQEWEMIITFDGIDCESCCRSDVGSKWVDAETGEEVP